MGWLQFVGTIKLEVSFAKEPYKRDDILPKRPKHLSILMTVSPHTCTFVLSMSYFQHLTTIFLSKIDFQHMLKIDFQHMLKIDFRNKLKNSCELLKNYFQHLTTMFQIGVSITNIWEHS